METHPNNQTLKELLSQGEIFLNTIPPIEQLAKSPLPQNPSPNILLIEIYFTSQEGKTDTINILNQYLQPTNTTSKTKFLEQLKTSKQQPQITGELIIQLYEEPLIPEDLEIIIKYLLSLNTLPQKIKDLLVKNFKKKRLKNTDKTTYELLKNNILFLNSILAQPQYFKFALIEQHLIAILSHPTLPEETAKKLIQYLQSNNSLTNSIPPKRLNSYIQQIKDKYLTKN